MAIDATKVHIRGGLNSASPVGRRSNPDPIAGRYRRDGNHDGQGAKTDVAAYEAETSVMLWNGPGENTLFPSLVSVISCHKPGELRGHAAAHMARHKALGFNHFTVVVDRAYNGEKIENFHLPAARLGLDLVFDYKQADLGTQSHFEDLILVDGSWYVAWMPQALIDVTKEFRVVDREITDAKRVLYDAEHTVTQSASPAALDLGKSKERLAATQLKEIAETLPTLQERLKMREPYRMIPKGRRSVDGFQRFSYPPVEKMLAKPPTPPQTSTITIPPTLPHNEKAVEKRSKRSVRANLAPNARGKQQPIKHTQRYPYKSAQWSGFYGMRSLVEASNSLLKTKDHGDIETPTKRSGRGYAAVYLAIAYAVVASNMKRIATFFAADAERPSEPRSSTAPGGAQTTSDARCRTPRTIHHPGSPPDWTIPRERFTRQFDLPTRRSNWHLSPAEAISPLTLTASAQQKRTEPANQPIRSFSYSISGIFCKYFRNEPLLRGQDLNLRPLGYEPSELPNCSTPRYN